MKALYFFLYISLVYCTTPSPPNIPTTAPAGWTLIYSEDFNVNATVGSFTNVGSSWNLSSPAAYVNSLFAYPLGWLDTSKNGQYNPSKTLSVDNSQLHIHLYAENTNFWVSAPLPALPTMTYGRYEECFRVSQSSGSYKVAWLLWPDSNLWPNDGEIDFPETNLNSTISAYMHFANASGGQDAYSTSIIISDGLWHVAITEWTAGQVLFYLYGHLGILRKVVGECKLCMPRRAFDGLLLILNHYDINSTSNHNMLQFRPYLVPDRRKHFLECGCSKSKSNSSILGVCCC